MIEWKKMPIYPQEELEENTYLIFLPNSDRVLSATHDAMNHYFVYESDDTQYVFPYRYVSHYAELNWPEE
jgi:hypothetical protein